MAVFYGIFIFREITLNLKIEIEPAHKEEEPARPNP